jgi:CheY-like chemotaxis protein
MDERILISIGFRLFIFSLKQTDPLMKIDIRHICLVEDDPDDHFLFEKILREINNNITLTWFQTCERLLAFLKTGNDLPSLIVLDMNMPGMSGQECLEIIKKDPSLTHLPVIIFSTAGESKTFNLAYEAGAHKYILKPFGVNDLRKIIREMLDTPLS